jgi:LPPG:FO 2-phospho-L-lactate transferase
VVAVSPVVSGDSLKGPTVKIMNELGIICSTTAIAQHYRGLIAGLLIDTDDAGLEPDIADLGIAVTRSDIGGFSPIIFSSIRIEVNRS